MTDMYQGACALAYDDLTLDDHSEIGEILELLDGSPDGDVIDAACGSGRVSAALAGSGRRVFAIDVNEDMLALLRERLAREIAGGILVPVAGSLTDLPFADGTAAIYVLSTSTIALFDEAQRAAVFRDAWRVLGVGGVAVISVHERPRRSTSAAVRGRSGARYVVENVVLASGEIESIVRLVASDTRCVSRLHPIDRSLVAHELESAGFTCEPDIPIGTAGNHTLLVARKAPR